LHYYFHSYVCPIYKRRRFMGLKNMTMQTTAPYLRHRLLRK